MRYLSFFILLLSFTLFEMGCNNRAPEQTSNEPESSVNDTLCEANFITVPDSTAETDSAYYVAYINSIAIPAGYNITNPKVNHFSIPISNIDTLIKWKAEGKILPNRNDDDSTWVMLALETDVKTKQQTITPYFACFSSLGEGKKGSVVYYSLRTSGKIVSINPSEAQKNMLAMQQYINALPKGKLFYPYGFQLPWNDLVGLTCSLQGNHPNNTLNGVLVINDENAVDYYLHSFYKRRFVRSNKMPDDDDDDDYFDFTSPCPTSCP